MSNHLIKLIELFSDKRQELYKFISALHFECNIQYIEFMINNNWKDEDGFIIEKICKKRAFMKLVNSILK